MTDKIIYVMEEDWDFLVVLDACRYDYFSAIHMNRFRGELEKGKSLGSCTAEWCRRSFREEYPDVIYVSGNPYINSKTSIARFEATRHFYKVVDAWKLGWSDHLGTVPPERIRGIALSLAAKYPEKRLIIHYLQPHAPYLVSRYQTEGFPEPNIGDRWILRGMRSSPTNRVMEALLKLGGSILVSVGVFGDVWELRELMGLPPASPMDAARRRYGITGLREAYQENLRIVLDDAANLCRELLLRTPSKDITMTSDHGELLGEGGAYSHRCGRKDSKLLEIPLFRVSGVRSVPENNGKIGS